MARDRLVLEATFGRDRALDILRIEKQVQRYRRAIREGRVVSYITLKGGIRHPWGCGCHDCTYGEGAEIMRRIDDTTFVYTDESLAPEQVTATRASHGMRNRRGYAYPR